MEKKSSFFRFAILASLILGLLGCAFFFFAFHSSSFDSVIRHFTGYPIFSVLGTVIFALALIGILVITILGRRRPFPLSNVLSPAATFLCAMSACLLLASVYFDFSAASTVASTVSETVGGSYVRTLRLRALLAILAAAYYVIALIPSVRARLGRAMSLVALAPLLWAISNIMAVYFNCSLAINDPEKVLLLMLGAVLILQTIPECRSYLPEKNAPSTLFLVLLVFSFGLGLSLLFFISFLTGLLGMDQPFVLSVLSSALYLVLCLFSAFRSLSALRTTESSDDKASEGES